MRSLVPGSDHFLNWQLSDAGSRYYFPPEEANTPSRMVAKALAMELAGGGPEELQTLLRNPEQSKAVAALRHDIARYTRACTLTSLVKHLRCWGRDSGCTSRSPAALWRAVAKHIDWPWVVGRLQEELRRHAGRKDHRRQELSLDMPWEHIEALEQGVWRPGGRGRGRGGR